MCRNIRPLFNFEPPATDDEILAAATQFVRKVAGTTRPSKDNEAAFLRAVEQIADVTRTLVRRDLVTRAEPRTREAWYEAARARGQAREERARRAARLQG